jgi:diketogulonate reductase-like aldo/keto reductase
MEELVAKGLVRAIGLSNIGERRLRSLLAQPALRVPPAVVQVEVRALTTRP